MVSVTGVRRVPVVLVAVVAGTLATISLAAPVGADPGPPPVVVDGVAPSDAPSDEAAVAKEEKARSEASSQAATESKTLTISTQEQQRSYWCAPASGRAVLSAIVSGPPTQAALASRMGTTQATMTLPQNIPPALNQYQSRNFYVRSVGMSLADFRTYVRNGIRSYSAPSIVGVQMANLPWYAGTGVRGRHAVTLYGYATATKVWNVSVYDPFDDRRHTGTRSGTIYDAGIDNHTLIW